MVQQPSKSFQSYSTPTWARTTNRNDYYCHRYCFYQTLFQPVSQRSGTTLLSTAAQDTPVVIVVQAEINPDRMSEFLALIETNAQQSRSEPLCLRFDVVQVQGANSTNQFIFYEVYESTAGIDYHKTQSHYQAWANFKKDGGVVSSTTYNGKGIFMT
jgi:(4S)-4-hydroxy-5-phosphonooxypentane-2,3-dione isomerase